MPIKASLATKTGAADDPQLKEGWLVFPARVWSAKDRIRITLNLRGETVAGTHLNQGRVALKYGPFVLAYDEKRNPAGRPAAEIVLKAGTPAPVLSRKTKVGLLEFQAAVRATGSPESITGTFVPFADAGLDGGRFQVWIPLPAQ